jgi:ElaB/YqjD/DUF883 family membrane-anchored ribosome-binding protein
MEESRQSWSGDTEYDAAGIRRPVAVKRVKGADLESLARQAGTIAGEAVALVRQVRHALGDREGGGAVGRIRDLRASATDRVQELRRAAEGRAREWRRVAQEKAGNLREQARSRYEQARARAEQAGRDHPLQMVVAAGAAGFLLGAALRRRKAHRAG